MDLDAVTRDGGEGLVPHDPTWTPATFYDDLADLYDVIYHDWEASGGRHAETILTISSDLIASRVGPLRVLDVSSGIGTQALPLASKGLQVTARDLSPGAVARLEREAEVRGVEIDAGVCDMRSLDVDGPFDLVLSLDNSIPHLPNDSEILAALAEARRVLVEDGLLIISVRDYSSVERGVRSVHAYGVRHRGGHRLDVRQEWEWIDDTHYRLTMIIDEETDAGWVERLRTASKYYAIEIPRLMALMQDAGFSATVREDVDFFQPILTGRKST